MKPIIFPFTWMESQTIETAVAIFGAAGSYHPSAELAPKVFEESGVEVITPCSLKADDLVAILKDYSNWAEGGQSSDSSAFKAMCGRVPYHSETSISNIVGEIREKGSRDEEEADLVLGACVFLLMSQDLDEKTAEVDMGMDDLDLMESSMIGALMGETSEEDDDPEDDPEDDISAFGARYGAFGEPLYDHQGMHMTQERLESWARLADMDEPGPKFFLTPSLAVIEHIGEHAGGLEHLLKIGLKSQFDSEGDIVFDGSRIVSAIEKAFASGNLKGIPEDCGTVSEKGDITIDLFVLPGSLPDRILGILGSSSVETSNQTLVGLITADQTL